MIRQTTLLLTAVAVLVAATAVVRPAAAQPATPVRLLDVPYLPQTVALCGGAATAMVMRYWGATAVYAETFADLVRPEEGGIRGADLLAALHARGWDARAFRGDGGLVQQQLGQRRPLIALVEDRPGAFHFVVIVGWSNGRVIAHDPARTPFRVFDEEAFTAAWAQSGYWAMLALPPGGGAVRAAPAPEVARPGDDSARRPCEALVEEGVRLAVEGDVAAGRRLFEAATDACPTSSAPWRELAGLHVLRDDWQAAARMARRAVSLDASDQHAWRILATSLYLEGDADGALGAWNALGEPIIDLVNVRGLVRTRFATAVGVTGLGTREVLRRDALVRARRRLADMPSVQASRVTYRPAEGGRAVVEAAVVERPLLPTSRLALAAAGIRALTDREVRVDVSSPSGGGEVWGVSWRWWEHRPAVSIDFSAPGPRGGVRRVGFFSAEESFGSREALIAERRSGGGVSLADWTSRGIRWDVAAEVERWREGARAGVLSGGVEHRTGDDRMRVRLRGAARIGGLRTVSIAADADWRSAGAHEGRVMLARAGGSAVGAGAPMSLWSGADIGPARDPLLRAHPLLDNGVISRGVFGRTLLHGGIEWRQWHHPARRLIRLGPAVFVDAAKALRTASPFDDRVQIDAGVGLRLAIPGAGVVRLDVARGLRDGAAALSVGWTR